jgi:hypothetical protein
MAIRGQSSVSDDSSLLESEGSDSEHDGDEEDDDDDDDDDEDKADLDDLDLSSSAIHDLEMTALDPDGVPFSLTPSNALSRPPTAERDTPPHSFHVPGKPSGPCTPPPSRSSPVYSAHNGVVWTREEGDHDFVTIESS